MLAALLDLEPDVLPSPPPRCESAEQADPYGWGYLRDYETSPPTCYAAVVVAGECDVVTGELRVWGAP